MHVLIGFIGGVAFMLLASFIHKGWMKGVIEDERESSSFIHGSGMFVSDNSVEIVDGEVVSLERDDDEEEVIALEDSEIYYDDSEEIALPEGEENQEN